ncbi:hypothetical protein JYU34_020021 [Plutella xylostella]|uniref:Uncharacterized protein n=1 Tax=Plutella xylostella TaxID=51655 RepID=A0ABQ7PZK1_PLUXY|nr:hypothetical protein JYU34_020021 [Plutella xylostella]
MAQQVLWFAEDGVGASRGSLLRMRRSALGKSAPTLSMHAVRKKERKYIYFMQNKEQRW